MTVSRPLGKCLVTGASGFIGRRLLGKGNETGLDIVGWSRTDVDLCDPVAVRAKVTALAPDTVIHLAATPPARFGDGWSDVAREVSMLSYLAAAMSDRSRLIVAGSMAEYGCSGTHAEHDLRIPNTAYGLAKMAGSDHALALAASGKDVVVARLFGVYGAGETSARLLPTVVDRLKRNLPVPLSDGEQIRDFVHVDDICACLLEIGRLAVAPDVLNVGTGHGLSVRDACLRIADFLGDAPALLEFGAVERRRVDEDLLVADTRLLQRQLGHVPPQRFFGNLDFIDDFSTTMSGAPS